MTITPAHIERLEKRIAAEHRKIAKYEKEADSFNLIDRPLALLAIDERRDRLAELEAFKALAVALEKCRRGHIVWCCYRPPVDNGCTCGATPHNEMIEEALALAKKALEV
jgi:hypothetical protein